MSDLTEARELFANDRYATGQTGIKIEEVGPDYARCSLKLSDKHRNAYGGVMGGAIYTLADLTFAVASNFKKEAATVALSSAAHYMSATKGNTLYAESRLIKDGRTNCFFEIMITDDLNKDIAVVNFVGAHLPAGRARAAAKGKD